MLNKNNSPYLISFIVFVFLFGGASIVLYRMYNWSAHNGGGSNIYNVNSTATFFIITISLLIALGSGKYFNNRRSKESNSIANTSFNKSARMIKKILVILVVSFISVYILLIIVVMILNLRFNA